MKACSDKCPMHRGWNNKIDCPFGTKEGKCLYTAVQNFQVEYGKPKPWHIKEDRWLRPGETCLQGDYEMRTEG